MKPGILDSSDPRYGWVMVAVTSIFIGVGGGSMLTVSVFLLPLAADFGWLRGETALAYLVSTVSMGLSGIVMGYLSDRFSTRRVVLTGALGLGLSFLLLSLQGSLAQFYLFYCLLGGLGAAAFDAPLLAAVANWFNRNRGLAIGMTTAGRALGQGLVPFSATYLISFLGWRGAYATLGLVSLAALVPLAFLVRLPPDLLQAGTAVRREGRAAGQDAYPIGPKRAILWLSVDGTFCCTCMSTPLIHVVALARDKGIDGQSAAGVVLVIYVTSFVGRILFGRVADVMGGLPAYVVASASQTAMVFWFTWIESLSGFYLLAVLFGLGYSGVMTCLIVGLQEIVPVRQRGVAIGVVTLFAWLGMGLGGYQGGFFFDLTGDYTIPYANAVLAGVVNLTVVGSLLARIKSGTRLRPSAS